MRRWLTWGLAAAATLVALRGAWAKSPGNARSPASEGSTERVVGPSPSVVLAFQTAGRLAAEGVAAPGEPGAPPDKSRQPTSWGNAAVDLQLGVRLTGEPRPYHQGDALEVEVQLRNTGSRTVDCLIPYDLAPGSGNVPEVRDEKGDYLRVRSVVETGTIPLLPHTLKAGGTQILGRVRILIHPPSEDRPADLQLRMAAAPGKYRLTQRESVRVRAADTIDLHLTSGTIDFEVAGTEK